MIGFILNEIMKARIKEKKEEDEEDGEEEDDS